MKVKNPTKAQVQVVIDNLNKALPYAEHLKKDVDMGSTSIDATCGTPMCHAGWYGAIKCSTDKKKEIYPCGYNYGANNMAKDLGFRDRYGLTFWALDSKMWGNIYGDEMFSSEAAFGCDKKSISLKKIIKHWEGVQKRLPK